MIANKGSCEACGKEVYGWLLTYTNPYGVKRTFLLCGEHFSKSINLDFLSHVWHSMVPAAPEGG